MSHLHGCQHISDLLENLVLSQMLCCHFSEQGLEGTSSHCQSLAVRSMLTPRQQNALKKCS